MRLMQTTAFGCELQNLQHEVEIALQARGVADDEHRVRLAEAEKIPRGLLLCRVRHQRVAPGQVDKQ